MTTYHIILCHSVLYRIISYHIILHHIISYHLISYHMISYAKKNIVISLSAKLTIYAFESACYPEHKTVLSIQIRLHSMLAVQYVLALQTHPYPFN